MFSRGTGGASTGMGGNRVIIDDPQNPKQANSEAERKTSLGDYDHNLVTRLNRPEHDSIVVIMQRLHEKDLTGHITSEENDFVHLVLPATAESKQTITYPISGKIKTRMPGDVLWPDRQGADNLASLKRKMGSYAFSGQYQQTPQPAEGGIFKSHWWQYYKELPFPLDTIDEAVQSWDTAITNTAAYVVCQIWVRKGPNKYLVHNERKRMDFPETIAAFKRMAIEYPYAFTKLVENKATGPAVVAMMRSEIAGIVAVDVKDSKPQRAQAYAAQAEAGNIYLPADASWLGDFLHEHNCVTPDGGGEYWDQVDAASQAIDHFAFDNTRMNDDEDCIGEYAGQSEDFQFYDDRDGLVAEAW